MKEPHIKGEAAPLWPRVICEATRDAVDRGKRLNHRFVAVFSSLEWPFHRGNPHDPAFMD
jgi:hypothetical protein